MNRKNCTFDDMQVKEIVSLKKIGDDSRCWARYVIWESWISERQQMLTKIRFKKKVIYYWIRYGL
jgi:hypothetical protein